jgi:Adenylate and Guanylate cyclase catalytic domain
MGIICSKNAPIKPNTNACHAPCIVLCNMSGHIINMTQEFLNRIHYNKETIRGDFIGVIMSDYISYLHKHFFIPKYHTSSKYELNRLEHKLSNMSYNRPLIIYDLYKNPLLVNISIRNCSAIESLDQYSFVFAELPSTSFFLVSFSFINANISTKPAFNYGYYCTGCDAAKLYNSISDTFKQTTNKIVVICMDFIDSTRELNTNGAFNMAHINMRFYESIINIIRKTYYPFVYIHEVVGDSYVITLNTDWTYNMPLFCSTLAINFLYDIIHSTKEFVDIRVGISYGTVVYGLIGNTLRFFGEPMHMASRLEHSGDKNHILFDESFYTKICSELDMLELQSRKDDIHRIENLPLKGYGCTTCYRVHIPDSPRFVAFPV